MSIYDILLFAFLGAIVGAVGMFVVYITYTGMYPHKLKILQRVNGKLITRHTAARSKKDEDGNSIWVLSNKKIARTCPHPIDDALEINDKGKFSAACYMDDIGQVIGWVKYDSEEYSTTYKTDKNGKKIATKVSKLDTETLTANQRSFYLREFREAKAIQGQNLLQTLANLAPMFILGMVVIMGLVFAPDALKSYKEVQTSMQATANTFNEASQTIRENTELTNQILLNKQKIEGIAPADLGLTEQNTDKGD